MSDVQLHSSSELSRHLKITSIESEDGPPSTSSNDNWMGLSSDALEEILLSDSSCFGSQFMACTTPDYDIWSSNAENEHDWPMLFSQSDLSGEENCKSHVPPAVEVTRNLSSVDEINKDMNKSWAEEYKEIENQMSRLLFCEDLDDGMSGSRILKYFGENSLSYMIRKSCVQSDVILEAANPKLMSCKHCEQTYEVVTESEAAPTKTIFRSNLLSPVDWQLNFDWTKYDPPPWSVYYKQTDAETNKSSKPISCDCEYCRSRIWRKVCHWCATPL